MLSKYWAENGKTDQEIRLWPHACKLFADRLKRDEKRQLGEPEKTSLEKVPEEKKPGAAHGRKRKNTAQDEEPRTKPRCDLKPVSGPLPPGPNGLPPPNQVPVSNHLPPVNQLLDPHQLPAHNYAHPQLSSHIPFSGRPPVPNLPAPPDYVPPSGHYADSNYIPASNYHLRPVSTQQNPYQHNTPHNLEQFTRYPYPFNNTMMGASSTGYANLGHQGGGNNPVFHQGGNASMAPPPSQGYNDYDSCDVHRFNQNTGQQQGYIPGSFANLMNRTNDQGYGDTAYNTVAEAVDFTHHRTNAELQNRRSEAANNASGGYYGQQNLDPSLASLDNSHNVYENDTSVSHLYQSAQAAVRLGDDGMAAHAPMPAPSPSCSVSVHNTPMPETPTSQATFPQMPAIQNSTLQTRAQGLEWDRRAFPSRKADFLHQILIEGGINTITAYGGIHVLADMIKGRMLEEDPWCRANVQVFEEQWKRIRQVLAKWYDLYHENMPPEETLEAIAQMEALFIMEGMRDGLSRRGFWVFWIQGMKQVVQRRVSRRNGRRF
jgi:hypothetical protein